MRTAVLVLAASCALLAACIQEVPEDLNSGDGAGAAGAGGPGSGPGTGPGPGPGSSTGSSTGGGNSEAELFFNDYVKPLMSAKCASCHMQGGVGPNWLGASDAEYYLNLKLYPGLVVDPAESRLLLKPAHATLGPDTVFDATEAETVREWLLLEQADPTGDPVFDGPTPAELLEGFVASMVEDDWIAAQMPEVATQSTLYHTSCAAASCHKLGLGNNWMKLPQDLSDPKAFDMMKSTLNILSLVRTDVIPAGDGLQRAILVQSCRYIDKGKGGGGTSTHDAYALAPEHVERVENWFRLSTQRYLGQEVVSICP